MLNEDIKTVVDNGSQKHEKTTILERKAADTYLGDGGPHCDLCTFSKAE